MTAQSGSKRRSSSADRTCNASKLGNDATMTACTAAGLMFTPKNFVTPRVSLPARKAMECISQLSAKSSRKDQRTALDKNAQLRLSRHVASYLNKTGMVGDLLAGGQGRAPSGPIQSSDLKNMNKGAFITLFNLLYKKLGSRRNVDFNSANYHENIPMIAKKLGYPGVIYKSHLLTPSTPHSWPYIIAFLGWLVDLVEFQQPFETALENTTGIEEMAIKEFYVKSYASFIKGESEEPLEEHLHEFRNIICTLRNIQPEVMEELMERRNKLKAIMDDEEKSLNSFREQIEKEKAGIQELISEIGNLTTYNGNLSSEIEVIEDKIREEEKRKELLVAKQEQLKRDKESLKIICSKQQLSKPEWDQLVTENKEIRGGNQMLTEMCEQTKKVVDSLDLRISSIRNELHKVWFEITEASMSVQADSAQVSHLLKLIQNFSHLVPDAQRCLEEILNTLHCALAEITSRVEEDQAKAKGLQDRYREINNEAKAVQKKRQELMNELESLQSNYQLTACKFKEEEDKLSREVLKVQQQVKYIHESSLDDCNVELEKTKEMYKEKLEKLEVKKQDYASCLSDIQEMAKEYYKIAMEKITAFQAEAGELSKEIAKFTKKEDEGS